MKTYERFVLVPHSAAMLVLLASVSDWQMRDDNHDSPDGRMLLLRVGSPETVDALRKVRGAIELGTNLDAPIAKASTELTRAVSLSTGATVREKCSARFDSKYDPFA